MMLGKEDDMEPMKKAWDGKIQQIENNYIYIDIYIFFNHNNNNKKSLYKYI